jgi:hypothetical protein
MPRFVDLPFGYLLAVTRTPHGWEVLIERDPPRPQMG